MNCIEHKIKLVRRKMLNKTNIYKKTSDHIYELNRDKDYFVVLEHPKCGRTWLRFMLCQAISIYFHIPLENVIFDIVYPSLKLPMVYYVHGLSPKKSFQEYSFKNHFRPERSPAGIIFLVRKPERVMRSYYYQLKYRTDNKEPELYDRTSNRDMFITFSDFIRNPHYGIKKYVQYVDHYLNFLKGKNSILIKYEDMLENTYKTLSNVLTFIDIDLNEKQKVQIVEDSTFERMKAIERNRTYNVDWLVPSDKSNRNSYKVRAAYNEKIEDVISDDDIKYMKTEYTRSGFFKELGYC